MTACALRSDIDVTHTCMPCRQLQEVNSTVSARSLAAELMILTKHGAEYAAQGITHIQTVGIAQVGSTWYATASLSEETTAVWTDQKAAFLKEAIGWLQATLHFSYSKACMRTVRDIYLQGANHMM